MPAVATSRRSSARSENGGEEATRDGSRPVTIRDVAALSGVSLATVTRTFQGSPRVRPETSARVLESAKRLKEILEENAGSARKWITNFAKKRLQD